MRCYICDRTEWHSMDEGGKFQPYRELLVCKNCGNAAMRVEPEDDAKVLDYYRKEYRPAPGHHNLITSTRKLNYIMAPHMLGDFLKGKKGLVCVDVGAAIGYLPAHLRLLGHHATGSELTVTYRRFAEHFYGLPMTEDVDESLHYDLITIYHVLEHLTEPDKKLARYAGLLKDDGRLFVATPEWFNLLEQSSGESIQSVEHHFHKDHINIFSRQSLVNLFSKCGLMVEREDHITYGQTYLLRRARPGEMVPPLVREDWQAQAEVLLRAKAAIQAFVSREFEKATEVYPRFPEAWINTILGVYGKDPVKQQDMWQEALRLFPENFRARQVHGIWLYQNKRYEEAVREFSWVMEKRPNEDTLFRMAECYQAMGRLKESIPLYRQVADLNPTMWTECMNYICHAASKLPAWDERAQAELKEAMWRQAGPGLKIRPKDPLMEAINGRPPQGLGRSGEQTGEPAPAQSRRDAGLGGGLQRVPANGGDAERLHPPPGAAIQGDDVNGLKKEVAQAEAGGSGTRGPEAP